MFVTLEGPEGAGKSTVAREVCARLLRAGYRPLLTYEPGGTDLGRQVREMVLRGGRASPSPGLSGRTASRDEAGCQAEPLSPRAETLLFCAARAQLVDEVIRPHLRAGGVVVCDRYADSTLAYQCYGRGLPLEPVRALLAFATGGLWPDLTVLLDLDVAEGLLRKRSVQKDGVEADRFESQAVAFHARVRQGYLELARAEPERWVVIDASRPPDEVAARVWEQIERRLRIKRLRVGEDDAAAGDRPQ